MAEIRFIAVSGIVLEDGSVHVRPCWPLPHDVQLPPLAVTSIDEARTPVVIELFSHENSTLYRYIVPTHPVCTYPQISGMLEAPSSSYFAEIIPLSDECDRMHISVGGRTAADIGRGEPVELAFAEGMPLIRDGRLYVAWRVHPAEAAVLVYLVSARGLTPMGMFSGSGKVDLDVSYLGVTSVVVRLSAALGLSFSDVHSASIVCEPIAVEPQILFPPDQFDTDRPMVEFYAWSPSAVLDEDAGRTDKLEWVSSLDGLLGRGSYVTAHLSPGAHRVMLLRPSRNTKEMIELSTVSVLVRDAPQDRSG